MILHFYLIKFIIKKKIISQWFIHSDVCNGPDWSSPIHLQRCSIVCNCAYSMTKKHCTCLMSCMHRNLNGWYPTSQSNVVCSTSTSRNDRLVLKRLTRHQSACIRLKWKTSNLMARVYRNGLGEIADQFTLLIILPL